MARPQNNITRGIYGTNLKCMTSVFSNLVIVDYCLADFTAYNLKTVPFRSQLTIEH